MTTEPMMAADANGLARQAARGRVEFAPRQRQILALVADGLADKEIAARLGVSARTVRTHLERLYQRYGLHSRSAAVALWLRNGGTDADLQDT
jgi:DNA-binding CsgD family transcriptional regulator